MPTESELVARIVALEAQQAANTRIARLILEGKLTGADGAAGALVALEGGQTRIEVAPFDFG